MEKMIQIAESYGWAVDMDSDSIEFNQCSPAGEDFSFTVLTKDASDAESLAAEVRSYNEDNAALPYPIKITRKMRGVHYEDLPASKNDPEQGAGIYHAVRWQ